MNQDITQNVKNWLFSEYVDQKEGQEWEDAFIAELAVTNPDYDANADKGHKEEKWGDKTKYCDAKARKAKHEKAYAHNYLFEFVHHAKTPVIFDCFH